MALVSWLPLIPLLTFDLSVPLTLRLTSLISSFLLLCYLFLSPTLFFPFIAFLPGLRCFLFFAFHSQVKTFSLFFQRRAGWVDLTYL